MRLKSKLIKTWIFTFVLFTSFGISGIISAQQRSLQGTVTDSQDIPLPGVTIVVKGTTIGTVTDSDGRFQMQVPAEAEILVFSFVGMRTQELPIEGKTNFSVTMEAETIGIEEVVAIGYGTIRKADLTGSVATVSAEEVEKNKYANVLQGLQGRMPGVFITTDGSPVGNADIQIRGLTSFRSAPPLIVIDDLPTNTNLRDINPQDIASIQVLKDASAASIYGSRAASGVIIIETKQGKTGEARISYNGSFGVSSFMNRIDMMNTQQYGQALWQAAINDGRDPNTVTQIYNFDWNYQDGKPVLNKVNPVEWLNPEQTQRSADTDWFEAGSQLGLQNDHQLTISNGTEKSKTLFSLNYHENQGTQIHTMFRRFTVRLNSEYNLIKDRLTIGENISLGNIKMNNQNHSHSFLTLPSIIPVYAEDGSWGGTAYSMGMDDYNNPVRMLTLNKDNYDFFDKAVGSIYASLKLFKGLNIKTLYGIDYTTHKYRKIDFTWREAGGKHNPNNGVNTYRSNNLTSTWTNTLNYNLETGKHRLDALAGIETVQYDYEYIRGYRWDIELEDYDYAYLSSATGTQETYGSGDEWSLLSYFSKLNYVFDNKYLMSATLRYDGSSKFGENNRFGFFPAASFGWRITEEDFFKDVSFFHDLKFRASWGMNGNSNIPTNALLDFFDADYNSTAYGLPGSDSGQQPSGYRRVHTGNPDLKWEATEQYNVGFDFGILEGALTGSFDYFQKYTNDMLFEPPYIGAIGEGGYRWVNAADMSNKGFELLLTYNGNTGNDFSYSITGNISSVKNTIDNLPEAVRYTYGGNGLDDDILGRPFHSFYGFVADGLFKTQEEVDNSPEQSGKGLGRLKFKDLDGDGRITWDHDRTWIGKSDPDFMYGVNFDARYKNFDFNMFWQGIAGLQVRNDWKTYSDFWAVWTQQGFNHATRLLDAWTPDNPDSTIPALSMQNPNDERRLSTYFMESGAYLKLRHIELGYTLPGSLMSKVGIEQCRINLNAQNIVNLHKWWGDDAYTSIDPENPSKAGEYSSPYVRPQMFMVGINLSF
jgi:TonB-linked SusC/RagA family outer membrane protein